MKQASLVLLLICAAANAHSAILDGLSLTKHDSVLVTGETDETLFSWQATTPLVPASLTKLVTAHLAINKWGLDHRFRTDFLVKGETLWVKGYGDPFLVSEELDKLAPQLKQSLLAKNKTKITKIYIDNSYFNFKVVPGRSQVADPYNAPVSAVAANFNTAKLRKNNGKIESAEPQTPLTNTAKKLAYTLSGKVDRVNLLNSENAQTNFAEVLLFKLGWPNIEIRIDQTVADGAKLVYRHENSHTLADVLRGTLEFSNNFMANQVFLKLAGSNDAVSVSFSASRDFTNAALSAEFAWRNHNVYEGSGLSRENRLSAKQIDDLLRVLTPNKRLFKKIETKSKSAAVYAKTGTLNGVRSYAGFIEFPPKSPTQTAEKYRFVFNFNRVVPYRYRDQILEQLISDLGRLRAAGL